MSPVSTDGDETCSAVINAKTPGNRLIYSAKQIESSVAEIPYRDFI